MKTLLKSLVFLFAVAAARAQVEPAAIGGPGTLPISGNVHYAVRYAQTAQLSNILPNVQTSDVSGSFSYLNRNQHLPFTLDYTGGYTWTLTGPDYQTGQFQRLLLMQGINWRKSKISITDSVMYLPESPTIGFSGIPGTGEPIGTPNPAPSTDQTILTVNTHMADNLVSGEFEHLLNYATTLSAGGGSEILRFPDNNGQDTNTSTANGEVAERLNARNALYGRYVFAQYSFPGSTVNVNTQTGILGFRRKWTRNLSSDTGAGPEWISSTSSNLVPSTTNFMVTATLNYLVRSVAMNASYGHGTNGGSGYLIGGEVDTVQGGFARNFGMNLGIGLTGGYQRTSALNTAISGSTNASFGGAQSTWRAGRYLIFFLNYSATNQDAAAGLPGNVANQMVQTFGFGFGYSPREVHLRQ